MGSAIPLLLYTSLPVVGTHCALSTRFLVEQLIPVPSMHSSTRRQLHHVLVHAVPL